LFKDNAAATVAQIEKTRGRIVARDNSPVRAGGARAAAGGLGCAGRAARRAKLSSRITSAYTPTT